MAEGIATRSSRGHRTICVPIEEEDYLRIIHDPKAFRRTLDDCFRGSSVLKCEAWDFSLFCRSQSFC